MRTMQAVALSILAVHAIALGCISTSVDFSRGQRALAPLVLPDEPVGGAAPLHVEGNAGTAPLSSTVDEKSSARGRAGAIVGGVAGIAGAFLGPGVQAVLTLVGYALARAAMPGAKRYRQNWASAFGALGRFDVGRFWWMARAAEGVKHTSEDAATLVAVAERKVAAEKRREAAEAVALGV